jgi:hypothetical protein
VFAGNTPSPTPGDPASVRADGRMFFSSLIPSAQLGENTAPFTMTGFISGTNGLGQTVFHLELDGVGTASAGIAGPPSFAQNQVRSISYTFEPVPEPSTWMLFGSGTAWIVWRRMRQQNDTLP